MTFDIDISVRVVERVADACLRGEMHDALRLLRGEGRLDRRPVAEFGLDEAEAVVPRRAASRRASFSQTS